ncbi:unnamed protein product [Phytomonas sp. EM1]|nr:unnamed protein product [Phytomonas sp. EM1]|eukprot:CCW64260.1 unnamed protein product [Phytomonas sp. isolate EM1]
MSRQLEELIAQHLWDGQGGNAFALWWDAYRLSLKYNIRANRRGERIIRVSRSMPIFSSALIMQLAIYALLVESQPRLAEDLLLLLDLQNCTASAATTHNPICERKMNIDHTGRSSSQHLSIKLNGISKYRIISEWLHCECQLAYLCELYDNPGRQTENPCKTHDVWEKNQPNITDNSLICFFNTDNLPTAEAKETLYKEVLIACCTVLETLIKWLLQELVYFQPSKVVPAYESTTSASESAAFLRSAPFTTASTETPSQCPTSVLIVFRLLQSVCDFVGKSMCNKTGADKEFEGSRIERISTLARKMTHSYTPQSYSSDVWKVLIEGVLLPSVGVVNCAALKCAVSNQGTELRAEHASPRVSPLALFWIDAEESLEDAAKRYHMLIGESLSNSLFSKPPFSLLQRLPAALLLVTNTLKSWLVACADNSKDQHSDSRKDNGQYDKKHLVFPVRNSASEWDCCKKDRLRLYQALVHSLWPFLECEVSVRSFLLLSESPTLTAVPCPSSSGKTPQCSQGNQATQKKGKRSTEMQVTKFHINRLIDKGDWAAALELIPQVITNPLHAARKALTACEAAQPGSRVAWVGALSVWHHYATSTAPQATPQTNETRDRSPRACLGLREIGRLMTLLARAQRWQEALTIYQQLDYTQLDGYIFRQVAYALCSPRRRDLNSLVMELWADWRCKVGDEEPPTAEMVEQLLVAGLHGTDEAAACACALVREGLLQTQRPPCRGVENLGPSAGPAHPDAGLPPDPATIISGTEIPLDLAKNEAVLRRLLKDRWYSESWQSALALAMASRRPGLIEAVARKSPPHSALFESVLASSLPSTTGSQKESLGKGDNLLAESRESEDNMTIAVRMALASHAAMSRHDFAIPNANDVKGSAARTPNRSLSVGNGPSSRSDLQRREVQLIELVLDELLGRDKEIDIKESDGQNPLHTE